MLKLCLLSVLAAGALGAPAAEMQFDWSRETPGQCPPGFASLVTGPGKPANWTVFEEPVPPTLAPLTPLASNSIAKRSVLAVQSLDLAQDHCPLLLLTNEVFYDFTLTTRFKIAGGLIDPEAGVVFRAQDQSNYYVVRASTEGNLLWYRVVDGKRYEALGIGVKVAVPKDAWQELRVECAGSQTRCYLNGSLVIPPAQPGAPTNALAVNDTTFASGKIGFWTRADSKCYFVDTRVHYTPKVPFVQMVVAEIDKKYPRLLGLRIYADKTPGAPVVVGARDPHDLGAAGTSYEQDVIDRGSTYYLKLKGAVEVTVPLRDHNGDVVAALKTRMKSFPGETQDTAVARAVIVKKAIQERIATLQDMLQ
ncbi:MAG: family 16 glycoside hydrolase [Verrucomicrobiota bacterium]|jgi:hypothetical protein